MSPTPLVLPSLRRPRFRRHSPPPLRLTADDFAILRHVGEHRFLRSTHLVRLLPGRSADKIIRRLGALYHNGYLDRPPAQLDHYARAGSAPLVYALGNRGAAQFAAIEAADPSRVDWTDKNRDVGRPYLEHVLLIADFMIALELAVREMPAMRLVSAREILAAAPATRRRIPCGPTLVAALPGENELSVVPDKVFAIERRDTGHRNYFLLEADRATMPIARASLAQSSVHKKLLTYHLAHQARHHVAQWGLPGFRVLMLTRSAERIASMVDTLGEITDGKGSNVFLFADTATVVGADPLAISWFTGKGQRVRLLDR